MIKKENKKPPNKQQQKILNHTNKQNPTNQPKKPKQTNKQTKKKQEKNPIEIPTVPQNRNFEFQTALLRYF